MSSIEQPAPSHSAKPERWRAPGPSFRPHETGPPQPRMVRLTVNLPGDLVDRVRNAVYWSPNLKLSWLIAQSLRTTLAEMESSRHGPFPQRKNPLRAGRPRMVGQTMKLFLRARVIRNGPKAPTTCAPTCCVSCFCAAPASRPFGFVCSSAAKPRCHGLPSWTLPSCQAAKLPTGSKRAWVSRSADGLLVLKP